MVGVGGGGERSGKTFFLAGGTFFSDLNLFNLFLTTSNVSYFICKHVARLLQGWGGVNLFIMTIVG